MSKLVKIAVSTAALIACAALAPLSAGAGEAGRLTLGFDREPEIIGVGGDELYVGELQAGSACSSERTIEIELKQRGDLRYRRIRSGTTDADGGFEIRAPDGRIPAGRYFAFAPAMPGCPAVRSQRQSFPDSQVTIGFSGGRVEGEVRSSAADCERRRTVLIFRKARGESRFEQIARDRTSAAGEYSARPQGGLAPGRYYARALEQGSCGVDRSPRVARG